MIRKIQMSDVCRIAEIHVFGWRCAYRGIISDEYLFTKISVSKRIVAFTKAIEEDIEETYVFEDNSIIKGFMTMGTCRNADKKDAFELWGIYIDPLMKRNGIGRQLVEFCEHEAIKRGYTEIVLWVFKENAESRKFYEKMGYNPDGSEEIIEYFKATEIRYSKNILIK